MSREEIYNLLGTSINTDLFNEFINNVFETDSDDIPEDIVTDRLRHILRLSKVTRENPKSDLDFIKRLFNFINVTNKQIKLISKTYPKLKDLFYECKQKATRYFIYNNYLSSFTLDRITDRTGNIQITLYLEFDILGQKLRFHTFASPIFVNLLQFKGYKINMNDIRYLNRAIKKIDSNKLHGRDPLLYKKGNTSITKDAKGNLDIIYKDFNVSVADTKIRITNKSVSNLEEILDYIYTLYWFILVIQSEGFFDLKF